MVRGRQRLAGGYPHAAGLGLLELSARHRLRLAAAAAGAAVVSIASGAGAGAAPGGDTTAGTGARFDLTGARTRPAKALFDGERRIRLRYRFAATRPLDLAIRVVRRSDGEAIRRWVEHDLAPRSAHTRRWDGRRRDGSVPADGAYTFRIGPVGHRGQTAGEFSFHHHAFPVDGPHAYGDRFGEPRSGGRVHEGQDLIADCGVPLVAARGGRVQARGYSGGLYGHWLLIDGRATRRDYFYSHLLAASPLAAGDRVRTGERIGDVGMSGNARDEFCQLHFELWPAGYRHGAPANPLAALRRWDGWS